MGGQYHSDLHCLPPVPLKTLTKRQRNWVQPNTVNRTMFFMSDLKE